MTMTFEKWQALGNDYLIVEREHLPFPLTPARVRRLCHRHLGLGGDGILELAPPDEAGFVARLRIFNPDGSEAELSGNGAREAILYLRRRGWTTSDQFSIQTVAGEVRPTILSEVLPSQSSGIPPFFHCPSNRRTMCTGMFAGSVPTSSLVPVVMVSGRSVLSRNVIQGTCITVVSSVMPPESVITALACFTR